MITTRETKKTSKSPRGKTAGRTSRFEARMTQAQKAMLERAAAYEGRSLTDFVVSTLASAAESVIHQHEVIRLNSAQSRAFVETLLNPPEPNAALRRAARKYRRSVKSS